MKINTPLLLKVYDSSETCWLAVYDLAKGQNWKNLMERSRRIAAETDDLVSMSYGCERILFLDEAHRLVLDEEDRDFFDQNGWLLLGSPLIVSSAHVLRMNYKYLSLSSDELWWDGAERNCNAPLSTHTISRHDLEEALLPRLRERRDAQEAKV